MNLSNPELDFHQHFVVHGILHGLLPVDELTVLQFHLGEAFDDMAVQIQPFLDQSRKIQFSLQLPVNQKYLLRHFFKSGQPVQQSVSVRMTRKALQVMDLSLDMDFFSEEGYILDPVQNQPAQSAFCLITHKDDAVFRVPEIVLQVMADSAGFTHATGGYDDLWRGVQVELLGFFTGSGEFQIFKVQGVAALQDQILGFFIKDLGIPSEYFRG